MNKHVIEYESNKSVKQLESWGYYRDSRRLLRALIKQGVDCQELYDSYKDDYYTMTLVQFKKIKEYYDTKKIRK